MQWDQLAYAASAFAAGVVLTILGGRLLARRRAAASSGHADERRLDIAHRLEALKHVIESAGIGTFFWDVGSDTLRWSERHFAIFGWPAGEIASHAMFRERVHPDDLAEVDAVVGKALREGGDYRLRFRVRRPDGRVRYLLGSGRVAHNERGEAASVNGAVIDVTHTTRVLNAAREHELQLIAVAAHLPDLVSRFDRQRRCLFMSPRIEELTGRTPDTCVGKTAAELGWDALLGARWDAVIEDVVRHKHVREFDFSHVDRQDSERFFIARAVPSFDAEGSVDSVLIVATDHTERERDARQVRESGALLEQADVRKNEYLATLAHELRGPLAPIASAAQLIKFSNDRTVRDKARDVIERQVAQLAQLVDELMEAGRISSGKVEIERTPVTIQHVLEQAVESVAPVLEKKEQALHADLPDTPIWIDGDLLRLTQVFTNLLTNASKYSPAGTAVSVHARAEGERILVSVLDKGIGLDADAMASIFELFVQVHATGVQAQGGLGIGLSLVKLLVELHGGRIMVASEGANRGSCFTVELPRREAPPATAQAQEQEQEQHAGAALTVLVVDDNVDGATTLAMLLEALGHTAVLAHKGLDAVARAAQGGIDLAFVDLGLPDISGVQAALRIRGTPEGRRMPLVALTGLGREEDRAMTTAARFDEHITKPLHIEDLMRIVQGVAKRRLDAGRPARA